MQIEAWPPQLAIVQLAEDLGVSVLAYVISYPYVVYFG